VSRGLLLAVHSNRLSGVHRGGWIDLLPVSATVVARPRTRVSIRLGIHDPAAAAMVPDTPATLPTGQSRSVATPLASFASVVLGRLGVDALGLVHQVA